MLSLLRQGLALEADFGTRSLEALLWIAEAVEEGVYVPGSLSPSGGALLFELANPPLRAGAFRALRATVDGQRIAPDRLRFRSGPASPWRTAERIPAEGPLELLPGRPTEFAVDAATVAVGRRATIRLELESVAIPPLVWLEFSDYVRPRASP